MLLAVGAWLLNMAVMAWLNPPPPPVAQNAAEPAVEDRADAAAPGDGDDAEADDEIAEAEDPPAEDEANEPDELAAAEPAPTKEVPEQWLTLGSLSPASPYQMLVLLSNAGASVQRIELNAGFEDLEQDKQPGYLGPLAEADAAGGGALVRAVGPGTPAAAAGLLPGDVIQAVQGVAIDKAAELAILLSATEPENTITLDIERGGKAMQFTATLAHPPLALVKREWHEDEQLLDPASLLMTLRKLGDAELNRDAEGELAGLHLRDGNWEVRPVAAAQAAEVAEFVWTLENRGLEIVKRYRLARETEEAAAGDPTAGYHLDLEIEIRNLGKKPVEVAYRLDGPTGLPTEGWWYANKVSREWFAAVGARDVAMMFHPKLEPYLVGCPEIAQPDFLVDREHREGSLVYAGVDAQYFSAILIPQKPVEEVWHSNVMPIRAGPVPEAKALRKLLNTSCRLDGKAYTLEPRGTLAHTYRLFGGPKKPAILAQYGLEPLSYYGWFGAVSRTLLGVLHFFHGLVGNYGLAIIMLTVLVRGCMFPISRKQALGAQKMQELQPELKKIAEKHKNNPLERNKATQELFRKHSYNPFGGCLLVFLQLPIFMGLYRGLMVDPELRQAPLIPGLEWASNLAAPDMMFRWDHLIPFPFLTGETGFLGPYFNLLPVFTVGLFLWQQKLFMPPPADEQQAMQQKMMKYMMVFMAVMFFKVASGLCIYFIASSLWGIAERKILPRTRNPSAAAGGTATAAAAVAARATSSGNGAAAGKRKKQSRK